jgi:hypothetical protein
MACPNFKNGPKTGLRPLGVKQIIITDSCGIRIGVLGVVRKLVNTYLWKPNFH